MVCGFCKYPQNKSQTSPDALPVGTELRDKRFLVGAELGRGGFGITYVGYDTYLKSKVAIKEYYPQTLAARLPGEVKMYWRSEQLRDIGRENVKREARKMYKLGAIPVAVRVLDIIEENNTAYIAMDYVDGDTLKAYLLENGVLSPDKCMQLMLPVLDTMMLMHKEGIVHRDISPDNIMIQRDGTPRILDLGAAKDIRVESGNTVLVAKNGFAPKEQYQTEGEIGTWTDVYALCATMYYSITGKVPPSAMDRREDGNDLVFQDSLPKELCQILRDGMRVRTKERIQNVAELKARLEAWLHHASTDLPQEPEKPDIGEKETDAKQVIRPQMVVRSHPVSERIHSSSPPNPPEKPKGLLSALLGLLGRQKKTEDGNSDARNGERLPKTVVISQPDAFPCYQDPNATVCLDDDEDGTVLAGEEESTSAAGYLIQDSTGIRVDITKCCFVLGRFATSQGNGALADCMIEDAAKHISRRHVVILFDGTSFYLQDISGKNSTQLNGVRIQNGSMPVNSNVFSVAYPLYNGDSIRLAEEKLTFHTGGGL